VKKIMVLIPVIAGIFWGSVGIFVRTLSAGGLTSGTILAARFGFATIALLIFLLIYDKNMLKIKLKDLWVFLGAGILGMLGLNYCYNKSIGNLTLSLAAVLLSLAPIFVMILAAILFKEKITKHKVICMFVAILGCLLVSGLLEVKGGVTWSVYGIFIGIMSAFFYALYSIFSKYGMQRNYHSFTILFYSLLIATIVLIPLSDWGNLGTYVSEAPVKRILFLIIHSIITSVMPYLLFTFSLNYVEAGKAAILAAGGEPTSAMILSEHWLPLTRNLNLRKRSQNDLGLLTA